MQPVPDVSKKDVERIVQRDFQLEQFMQVMDLLGELEDILKQKEPLRIQLAVLKLADGNLERLRIYLDTAKIDYRDVLGPAEYPAYIKRVVPGRQLTTDEERQEIMAQDWLQYETWLFRT